MAERMISTHSAIHSSADDRNDGATSIAASSRNDGDMFAAPPDVHASPSEPLLGNSRSSAAASTSPLVKRSAAGAGTSAYAPIESGHVAATSTSVPMKEVHVDLYIRGRGKGGKGKGPACSFAAQLLGWHADRLDVAAIKRRHGLKALFAFSSAGARGLELVANPRNGLSLTTYTGKPGSRITLDGEPKGAGGCWGMGGGGGGRWGVGGGGGCGCAEWHSELLWNPSSESTVDVGSHRLLLATYTGLRAHGDAGCCVVLQGGAELDEDWSLSKSVPGDSRKPPRLPWSASHSHPPLSLSFRLLPLSPLTHSPSHQEPFLSHSLVAAGGLLFSLGLLLLLVSHNPHFASLLATHNNAPSSPVMLFGVGVFVLIFWKKFTEWYK
ncbi:unnamed protein product [Closterium sp. Naga37s-1]|nr:unnamed protein product [Closterium sp. Naga37s-1]